ncbi:RNA-directed DNA polymerase from mobile element jockey-like [Brachionus plicatilis]|uniref:RNA-directed DNA polymerase from mobile element jockey-like n=1 Tax=Brachionus plicatilis TaxID=10195 RepID=A0A3M7RBH0_BRAPC|nr:RNA-directed DNA polymerase from mobile element jockey-like [Brachionus plicatilis]
MSVYSVKVYRTSVQPKNGNKGQVVSIETLLNYPKPTIIKRENEQRLSSEYDNRQKKDNKMMNSRKKKLKTKNQNNLTILHWNCKHLPSKLIILKQFLSIHKPDIMLLNEIKMDITLCNYHLNFQNYQTISKMINVSGGGVAMLILKYLDFSQIESFDSLNLELISIDLKLKNFVVTIIGQYNPSEKELSYELFELITARCPLFVLAGDLDSKTLEIGCHKQSVSGSI